MTQKTTELYIGSIDENTPGAAATKLLSVRDGGKFHIETDGRVLQNGQNGRMVETWNLCILCNANELAGALYELDSIAQAVREYWEYTSGSNAICIIERALDGNDVERSAIIYSMQIVQSQAIPVEIDPDVDGLSFSGMVQLVIERAANWESTAIQTYSTTVGCLHPTFTFDVPDGHNNRIARLTVYDWFAETSADALAELWIGIKPDPADEFVGESFLAYEGGYGSDSTVEPDAGTKDGFRAERQYLASTDMDYVCAGSLQDYFSAIAPDSVPGSYIVIARMHANNSSHYVRIGTCMDFLNTVDFKPWAWQRPVVVSGNIWSAYQVGTCIIPTIGRYHLQPETFQIAFQCERISGAGRLYIDYFALLPTDVLIHLQGAEIRYEDPPVVDHRIAVVHSHKDGNVFGTCLNGSDADPALADELLGLLDTRGATIEFMNMRLPGKWTLTSIAKATNGFHPVLGGLSYKIKIEYFRGFGMMGVPV